MWNAARIKSLRQRLDLSQSKFGERVGVHRRTVEVWESDYPRPNPANAAKLDALDAQTQA